MRLVPRGGARCGGCVAHKQCFGGRVLCFSSQGKSTQASHPILLLQHESVWRARPPQQSVQRGTTRSASLSIPSSSFSCQTAATPLRQCPSHVDGLQRARVGKGGRGAASRCSVRRSEERRARGVASSWLAWPPLRVGAPRRRMRVPAPAARSNKIQIMPTTSRVHYHTYIYTNAQRRGPCARWSAAPLPGCIYA